MRQSRFEGRTVLVTGASSGIGRATALCFAKEGASVVAVARRVERLEELAAEASRHVSARGTGATQDASRPGSIEVVGLDVRDRPALRSLIDSIADRGRLDVLVNNAGVAHAEGFLEVSDEHWDDTIEINLNAAFVASQAAARHMASAGGGAIVNVASVDGRVAESPFGAYCPSKAGLVMLTRMIATELGHLGIRCNAICPGMTVTEMTEPDIDPEFDAAYRPMIPMGRYSSPEEQARVILFLASEDASFVNGATIDVDGGQTAGFWYAPQYVPPFASGGGSGRTAGS